MKKTTSVNQSAAAKLFINTDVKKYPLFSYYIDLIKFALDLIKNPEKTKKLKQNDFAPNFYNAREVQTYLSDEVGFDRLTERLNIVLPLLATIDSVSLVQQNSLLAKVFFGLTCLEHFETAKNLDDLFEKRPLTQFDTNDEAWGNPAFRMMSFFNDCQTYLHQVDDAKGRGFYHEFAERYLRDQLADLDAGSKVYIPFAGNFSDAAAVLGVVPQACQVEVSDYDSDKSRIARENVQKVRGKKSDVSVKTKDLGKMALGDADAVIGFHPQIFDQGNPERCLPKNMSNLWKKILTNCFKNSPKVFMFTQYKSESDAIVLWMEENGLSEKYDVSTFPIREAPLFMTGIRSKILDKYPEEIRNGIRAYGFCATPKNNV